MRLTVDSPLYMYEACFGSPASYAQLSWVIEASESAKIHPGLAVGGYVFILFWSISSGGKVVKNLG